LASPLGIEVQSYRIGKKKKKQQNVGYKYILYKKKLNSGPALILYITVKTLPSF